MNENNTSYVIIRRAGNHFTIKRIYPPIINIGYDAITQDGWIISFEHSVGFTSLKASSITGEFYEYLPDSRNKLTKEDFEKALEEAVIWAKKNIVLENV